MPDRGRTIRMVAHVANDNDSAVDLENKADKMKEITVVGDWHRRQGGQLQWYKVSILPNVVCGHGSGEHTVRPCAL